MVLEMLSTPESSTKDLEAELHAFMSEVGGLSKAGSFSASDAKTYGPSLIKVVNTCVKLVPVPARPPIADSTGLIGIRQAPMVMPWAINIPRTQICRRSSARWRTD